MKTLIILTVPSIVLFFSILAVVLPPQASTVDLQVYQVICIEKDGSEQLYEYVAETQQSYAFEKDFCEHVAR